MDSDKKSDIKSINEFIEKHSLQKILKIVYAVFGGLIALNIVSSFMPEKYYDCSKQGTQVVDKVLACEQQKLDERIREKELDLEKYKVSENYKMEKLKAVLQKTDFSDPKKLLRELQTSSLEALSRATDSCTDKAIQTMCEVKFK